MRSIMTIATPRRPLPARRPAPRNVFIASTRAFLSVNVNRNAPITFSDLFINPDVEDGAKSGHSLKSGMVRKRSSNGPLLNYMILKR